MSVLVVGSVAFDSIETPFGKHEKLLGGSATYFSISASYFTDVMLVAVVGRDFPKKYIDLFHRYRVDTKGLKTASGETFHWKGRYQYDMNTAQTISTHLNVFSRFDPRLPGEYRHAKNIFLANIDPDLQKKVLSQVSAPGFIACDTMNYWIKNKPKKLAKLAKKMDLFFLNDGEAREFSGETNLLKAARFILTLGTRMVIIKKGEHGSLFFSKKGRFAVPGLPLETIVDPTGAGDTFAGGVMGYLARLGKIDEAKVRKAIIYGSVMASFDVEAFSLNRLLKLNHRLIKNRYREFRKLTCF